MLNAEFKRQLLKVSRVQGPRKVQIIPISPYSNTSCFYFARLISSIVGRDEH